MTLLVSPARTGRAGVRMSGQRVAVAGVAAVVLANLSVPGRPATLCPFRAITGIPCPFCGGTTAAVRIGHLDLLGALRANPVVVVGALVVMAIPAVTSLPRVAAIRTARPTAFRRTIVTTVVTALTFSEVWQLFRFGIF